MGIEILLSVLGAGLASIVGSTSIYKFIKQLFAERYFIKNINKKSLIEIQTNLIEIQKVSNEDYLKKSAELEVLKKKLEILLKDLEKQNDSIKEISESLNQKSIVGQERYIEKLISKSLEIDK